MASLRILGALAVTLCIAACKAGPDFVPPNEPTPRQYAAGTEEQDLAAAPNPQWWTEFHDPQLDQLEAQAVAENLNLKAAYLRIVASRMQVQAARAEGLPSLDAMASYKREQLGLAGVLKSQGVATGSAPPAIQDLISSLEKPVNLYQLDFDASWELDLFGKVRRSVEAASAESAQTIESRNDLLISLQAEIAETYLQLRAAQLLRQITLALIADQRESVELTANKQQHGLGSELDVQSARAQLANMESQLPPFDQTVASSRHALAVLCGKPPEAFDGEFGDTGQLPSLPPIVPAGLPSTLARRRPDIRNAEAALHAATARIGVSMASLYPQISLTGNIGLRNTDTRYLFDWASKFYAAGPTVSVPIFHGGALLANVRLSRADAAAAALRYRGTVLGALQEVEDGLSNFHEDARRTAALDAAVAAEQRAVDISVEAYRHGLVTYLAVLTVQLQAIQARQQLAQSQLAQSIDLIKLYKALGGGWENPSP